MREFNAANELVKVKGKPKLKYDAKGNLTKGHDRKKRTWDIDRRERMRPTACMIMQERSVNHLASISASGAKLLATYTYDALGRRVSKTTRTTKKGKGKGKGHDSHDSHGNGNGYVCHGNQVIEEYVNGAYAKCYAYGAYTDDCVASIDTTDTVTTYHRDRQFNTIGLTDAAGAVENLCAYTRYGDFTCTDASGRVVDASTLDNEYWYTGRRLDKESGLWYFRARYFDSAMGGFISRDPLGYVDGAGLYNGYFAMLFGMDAFGEKCWSINATPADLTVDRIEQVLRAIEQLGTIDKDIKDVAKAIGKAMGLIQGLITNFKGEVCWSCGDETAPMVEGMPGPSVAGKLDVAGSLSKLLGKNSERIIKVLKKLNFAVGVVWKYYGAITCDGAKEGPSTDDESKGTKVFNWRVSGWLEVTAAGISVRTSIVDKKDDTSCLCACDERTFQSKTSKKEWPEPEKDEKK